MSKKLTPWFPGDVKPARKGWYEVQAVGKTYRHTGFLSGRPFRYWDGRQWLAIHPRDSALTWKSIFGTNPSHQWRGLAEKP